MTDARPVGTETVGPPPQEAGGILTIDLAAVVANWRELARRSAPAECAAVVKADAYGCGLGPVARALYAAGCRTFFVAHLSEARQARAEAQSATIYVLNGLPPGTASAFAADNLWPVLCSFEEISEWQAFRSTAGWNGLAALQIDTGMNRLGVPLKDASEAAGAFAGSQGLALLMSHFACSENRDQPLNATQMRRFAEVRVLFPKIPGSLANSSGIFLGPEAHHDLVRPGVALFGVNPTPGSTNPMRTVVTLKALVVQVRPTPAGETVGYGATWTAQRQSRVAIVSVGYADGFPRHASGTNEHPGASAIVWDRRYPVVGRVSMDLLAIDVTDLPEGQPRRGDRIALLNETIGVDELAAHSGTIGYEILTRLGHRYHRRYIGG